MGGIQAHRVLYFWHMVGNKFLTLLSNMLTNLNLTDMETCYKVFRREVLQIKSRSRRIVSGSSRRSRPRSRSSTWCLSTRSASATEPAPTPKGRRSAGATAFVLSGAILKYNLLRPDDKSTQRVRANRPISNSPHSTRPRITGTRLLRDFRTHLRGDVLEVGAGDRAMMTGELLKLSGDPAIVLNRAGRRILRQDSPAVSPDLDLLQGTVADLKCGH